MNRDLQNIPARENSEIPLPPPPRFDERMVAAAQPVKPLPTRRGAGWRALWRFRRGGPGLLHTIAITAVLCIALGAILVGFQKEPDNSPSLTNRNAEALGGETVAPDLGNKSVRLPESSKSKPVEAGLKRVPPAFETRSANVPRQEPVPKGLQLDPQQKGVARKVDTLYFGRAADNQRKGKRGPNRSEGVDDH